MTYSEYVEKLNERVYNINFLGKEYPKSFRYFLYDVIGGFYFSEFYSQLCEDVRKDAKELQPFLSRIKEANISIVPGEKEGTLVAIRDYNQDPLH